MTATSAETLVLLLDAYSACLCAETNGHDRARARATSDKGAGSSASAMTAPEGANEGDFSTLPVPELLAWVNDGICGGSGEHGKMMYPEVHAALMRCMGRMAAACAALPGAGSAVSTHKRRVLANVITEGPLGMMVDAAYGSVGAGGGGGGAGGYRDQQHPQHHHHPAVTATAAVALWSVMHHSEQARAVARALLASAAVSMPLPGQPSSMVVMGEKPVHGGAISQITHRAQHAVALMLQ